MKKIVAVGFAVLLLAVFTAPAMAKVEIGGMVFTDFYYIQRDKDNWIYGNYSDESTHKTALQIPDITRLYARWTNEQNVGMYIELGLGQTYGGVDDSTSDDVMLRHAYGWWNINPHFTLMAGKSTSPFSPLNPSQLLGSRSASLNIIGLGYGEFYSGRFAQVRGTYRFNKNVRIALALVDPNGSQRFHSSWDNFFPYDEWGFWRGWDYQNSTKIPRIDVGMPIYIGDFRIYPSFLWQLRTVDKTDPNIPANWDNNLTTYIGSLGFKWGIGPLTLSAEGQWGKNWGNTRSLYGVSPPSMISSATIDPETGKIQNAETYGFWLDFSYTFGPVTPHLIYGRMDSKSKIIGYEVEGSSQMYGISVPIELAKGFKIRPEFMWYDDGNFDFECLGYDHKMKFGKYEIFGIQFQITF